MDGAAARRLVAALAPARDEAVLEIGPGRGALTALLLEVVPKIAAVEIDRDLIALLRGRFDSSRLVLLEGDVLELDLGSVLSALGAPPTTPLVLIGSLPYNISKPIVMKLVADRERIARAVLVFQREVAERLTASPGSKAYGPLTVLAGRAFEVRAVLSLPPRAFRPAPEVTSTVTLLTRRVDPAVEGGLFEPLRSCLQASFAHRRQTLLRNLRQALPGGEEQARELLRNAEIDPHSRAEAIPPDGFVALARFWPKERLV